MSYQNSEKNAFSSSTSSLSSIKSKTGLSVLTASVFIVGELAGSGILALPNAVAKAGWSGIFLIIFCAVISAHASVYLAECWLMVEEKWPEVKNGTRNPFATIGEKAVGFNMKLFCSFIMDIQLFGVCIVFLLFCSELTKNLVDSIVPDNYKLSFCLWIIIFGAVLIPLSWAGSPQDFKVVAFSAMSCTVISCFLVLIIFVQEGPKSIQFADYEAPSLQSYAMAFGTILFVYGGTCTFPTFQNDMQDKKKFPKAVYFGFLGMLMIYVPIAAGGYAIYGVKSKDNILDNTSPSKLHFIINILMAFHLFCAYLICINPLNLDIENALKIKHSFNFKRSLFRTLMTLTIIFVGLSVPKFGKILNLVGAFSVSTVAYILVPWFYINLCNTETLYSPKKKIPTYRKIYLVFILIVGTIGGCISTYFAVKDIIQPSSFTKPCYICWK